MSRSRLLRVLKIPGLNSLLVSLASLVLMIYGVIVYNPFLTKRVTYDYFAWTSTILTLLAVYWELKRLYKKPFYSTILLVFIGGLFTVWGRILSIYFNKTFTIGSFNALIGDYYTVQGFASSLLIVLGSFIVLIANILHIVLGGVIIIKEKPAFCDAINALHYCTHIVIHVFEKHIVLVAIVVGLFAFTFRFIPELHWWPLLIGWDTPEYVAHLLDFREKLNPFTSYYWMGGLRNTPPLLPMLLVPFTYFVDAWYLFKFYPSIAYAFMASLSAILAMEIDERRKWWIGLLSGFLTTIYVLNLRISWDYQRQLLGSVILLATILVLEKWREPKTPKHALSVLLLLVACGLSHEVTGFAGFILSLVLLYHGLKNRNTTTSIVGTVGLTVNTVLEIWYWRRPYSFVSTVGVLPPGLVASYEGDQALSYLVAGYGLILPLALIAMSKSRARYTTIVTIALLVAGISPMIAPFSSVTTWYRFLIGATPLVTTLATIGLVRATSDWRVLVAYLLIASLPGLSFAYGYNWFFTYYESLREFPPRLAPSPVYMDVYEFFKNNKELVENTVIIAWADHARYIHLAIRNPDPARFIWISNPWDLTNDTICRVIEQTGVEVVIIVGLHIDTNTTQYTCLEELKTLSEGPSWIHLAIAKKHRISS